MAIDLLSKLPASSVTVCGVESLFVQVTVPPVLMATDGAAYAKFLMETVAVAAGGFVGGVTCGVGAGLLLDDFEQAAKAIITIAKSMVMPKRYFFILKFFVFNMITPAFIRWLPTHNKVLKANKL